MMYMSTSAPHGAGGLYIPILYIMSVMKITIN